MYGFSVDNVVLVAKIPGLSDPDPIEIIPELWPNVSQKDPDCRRCDDNAKIRYVDMLRSNIQ